MKTQENAFAEAKRLASLGEEYSFLINKLDPNQAIRLKHYVLRLPEEIIQKTIYGRVAWRNQETQPKVRGRPRKL